MTSADKALPRSILTFYNKRTKVKKLFLFELKQTTKHEGKKFASQKQIIAMLGKQTKTNS